MTHIVYERTASLGPDTNDNWSFNCDSANGTPEQAYQKAKSDNLSLPHYPDFPIDQRLTELIRVKKLAETYDKYTAVSDMPSCSPELAAKAATTAAAIQHAIDSESSSSWNYLITSPDTPESSLLETPEPYSDKDPLNYANRTALSSVLTHDAVTDFQGKDTNLEQIARNVDTDAIVQLCELRAEYPKVHTLKSLAEKGAGFTMVLKSLSDVQAQLASSHGMELSKATASLLSAKTLHDLALLGEFGSKEKRDDAVCAAVAELQDARESLALVETKFSNDITRGMRHDIENYLQIYADEVSIDPNKPLGDTMYELSDEQIANMMQKFGAEAIKNA